jgi:hypothetical protein
MGDLLATALSDAGIGFDPEATASTSNNNSVQEMPPLKIMPNSSDVPSSVSYFDHFISSLFKTNDCCLVKCQCSQL